MVKFKDIPLLVNTAVTRNDALIIVDLQNDFMPSGALSVKEGDRIISPINKLASQFYRKGRTIILTQDWHPPNHYSFASTHNLKPYTPYYSDGIGPILWPDHCVQGSNGAEFHRAVKITYANAIIRKGSHITVDSYSIFIENDKKTSTGLAGYLHELGKKRIFICGLALDYCVYYSAIDGRNLNFEVVIPIDLSIAIDSPPGHLSKALNHMVEKEVFFIHSQNIKI